MTIVNKKKSQDSLKQLIKPLSVLVILFALVLSCSLPLFELPDISDPVVDHINDGAGTKNHGPDFELKEKRTYNTKFFKTRDDTVTAEVYLGAVHYLDENGEWKDIETEVVPLERNDYIYGCEKNGLRTYFEHDGIVTTSTGQGDLLTWRPFSMVYLDSNGNEDFLSARRSTEPVNFGNVIIYDDIFEYTADEFIVNPNELKHNIILKAPPRAPTSQMSGEDIFLEYRGTISIPDEYSFSVNGVPQDGDFITSSGIEIENGNGQCMHYLPPPYAYEAGNDIESRSLLTGEGGQIPCEYVFKATKNLRMLHIRVPWKWLGSPERNYPIIIDPTDTIQPGGEGKDTWITGINHPDFGDLRSANWGAGTSMEINQPDIQGTIVGSTPMLQFDLSGIPAVSEVSNADFSLYQSNSADENPLSASLYRITKTWTEGTGTSNNPQTNDGATWLTTDGSTSWSNDGGDYDGNAEATTEMTANGWYSWTITSLVQSWVDGNKTNNGFLLKASGGSGYFKVLESSDAGSNRPKLVVEYISNKLPTAIIDNIDPNPARELTEISMNGHGTDPEDGNATAGFLWTARKDSRTEITLGTEASITIDNLTHGTYTIGFRVLDSEGGWSDEATETLVIDPDAPPGEIDDLEAEPHGSVDGAINLTWSAVAEDGEDTLGAATEYIIKYSDGDMDSQTSFDNADDPENEDDVPEPDDPGTTEHFTVTGLTNGEKYYFAVIALDASGKQGEISNIAHAIAPDHNEPGQILDLNAEPGEEDGEIELEWTAPGDDGADGFASSYDIRCSTEEILDISDFYDADDIPNKKDLPSPDFPGFGQHLLVTDLEGGTTYYFAIVTKDESGNSAPLSNIASSVAKDLTAPLPIIGLSAMDTPNDEGRSITVSWIATDADDLDHYAIYVSKYIISDVQSKTPDKMVTDGNTTAVVTTAGGMPLSDWTDYYVAVTAVDLYDNEMIEVESAGPVFSINNLERPQPLINPEEGETYSRYQLSPNKGVDVEMTEINVALAFDELSRDRVKYAYTYNVDGTVSVLGDSIDHLDLYIGTRENSGDWDWLPIMDIDNFEKLDPEDPDYIEDFYELFEHPDLVEDTWSLIHMYSDEVDEDEFDVMEIGSGKYEYALCVVAWTKTFEWNYYTEEFDLDITYTWKDDNDGDEVADGWEKLHFGDTELYDAKGDPDGDGHSNLKEYEDGTDPNDAESYIGERDIFSRKEDSGFPLWIIIVIAVVLVLGALIIVVIVLIRKSGSDDEPVHVGGDMPPIPIQTVSGTGPSAGPPGQRSGPPGQRSGPSRPPQSAGAWGGGPSGPPPASRGPPGPPKRVVRKPQQQAQPEESEEQKRLLEIQHEYQTILAQAMAIREQITQAQDAQEKQRLTAEYRVLEKKVADLQKQAQGGTAGAGEVEAQVEEKALPGAGIDDQLALPQGDTAQKGEPAEQAEAKKSEKKALEDSLFDFGDNKEKESDEAGEVKPVLIECHVCGATNVVSTSERPAVVECSSCGEQGYLAE